MKINSISITRRADYEKRGDDKCDFKCRVAVNGETYTHNAQIEITVDEEQLEPIVAIISQIVADNMRVAAEKFQEEVQASLAGPVIEQIEEAPKVEELDDDIPF